MTTDLHLTGDDDADALLSSNPFALLTGMLLDQQVTMESAFAGPLTLQQRLGGMDPRTVADAGSDAVVEACSEKPAVHRYPRSMGERIHALATAVCEDWGGDTAAIWTTDDPDGREVLKRLKALPGFGDQKARIFLALLGKQRGVTASGWQEAAGEYGAEGATLSVADVTDPSSIQAVRETKQRRKAAAKKKD